MRTKTLLLAAVALAAGALYSQAQSNVYSANVVGYVNLAIKPGYNLLTAQLKNTAYPTAPINPVLTNCPALTDGSTLFGWNAVSQSFTESAIWVQGESAWYNADGSALATDTVPLGKAFFIYNAGGTDATLTLVGEVQQGTTPIPVPNAYSFLGDAIPTSQGLATNAFPIVDSASLFTFDPLVQSYTEALVGVGPPESQWYNADGSAIVPFAPEVGQGFVHFAPAGSNSWSRAFQVK
jgi:hypothetical protein